VKNPTWIGHERVRHREQQTSSGTSGNTRFAWAMEDAGSNIGIERRSVTTLATLTQ
jgi:hypothetical protein